jgi:hypothetical protein
MPCGAKEAEGFPLPPPVAPLHGQPSPPCATASPEPWRTPRRTAMCQLFRYAPIASPIACPKPLAFWSAVVLRRFGFECVELLSQHPDPLGIYGSSSIR